MRTSRYWGVIVLGTIWISVGNLVAGPALELYIVSKEAKPGWRYFNSTPYPDLGYVANAPDLTVVRIESVERKEVLSVTRLHEADGTIKATEERQSALLITFYPDDVKAFGELTSAHLHAHVLFMLGNEAIFAPTIQEPISGASISIQLPDGSKIERVKAELEQLCGR